MVRCLYGAPELEWRLGQESNIEVTLVNRDNFFVFTPMLNEAASDLELTRIVNPRRELLRKGQLFSCDGKHADLAQSQLTLSRGSNLSLPSKENSRAAP